MARYSATVRDQNQAPVVGALVTVERSDGTIPVLKDDSDNTLANPLTTDSYGGFYFNSTEAFYDLSYIYGGRTARKDWGVAVGGAQNSFDITLEMIELRDEAEAAANAADASADAAAASAVNANAASILAGQYRDEAEFARDESETAAGQALAAAATLGLKIQTDPATPTVPPAGAASGDNYLATEPTASYLILYLNTAGTGAPVLVSGLQVRIPLMNGVQAVIDALPDLIEALGMTTVATRMGRQTVGAGASLFGLTDYSFVIFRATESTSLGDIALRVGVLGSGAVSIGVYSGDPETGNLTCVSRSALPAAVATAGNVETWTAPLPSLIIEKDQWVALDFPGGGVQPRYSAGGVVYSRNGLLAVSASGAYANSPATTLEAYIDTTIYTARGFPRASLAREAQTALSIAEASGTTQTVYTGFPGPFDSPISSINFDGMVYIGTAKYAGFLEELDIQISSVGSGVIRLGISKGSVTALSTVCCDIALPAIASTGAVNFKASLGDYAATYLEAGDNVFLATPTGGARATRAQSPGDTLYFLQDAVGAVGQRLVLSTALPDQVAGAQFRQTAKALPVLGQKTPTIFDMFLIAGQSNAVGLGNGGTPKIRAGIAKQYYSSALTDIVGDPVGNANISSAWPAFANEYYRRTGRGVIFVPTAILGSALQSWPGTNWSSAGGAFGTARGLAAAAVANAQTAADTAGVFWQFAGVLWIQGETDATQLALGTAGFCEAGYVSELATLKSYFETQFGIASGKMPFLLAVTGQNSVTGDDAGWQAIRRAQRTCTKTINGVYMAHNGAKAFSPNEMKDALHYISPAYTKVGEAFATVAAARCIGNA